MTDYTRKAVRGAGIVLVLMVASNFMGYIFRMFLARELGASSYGLIYAIVALFGVLVTLFMSFGLEASLTRYIPKFRVENKPEKIKGAILTVLSLKFLLSVLVCGIIILLSDTLALEYFKAPEASILIKIYAVGIIFSSIIATLRPSLQGFQSMKYFSSVDFVKSFFTLAITAPLLFLGLRELAPILGFTLTFIIVLPIFGFLALKKVFPELLRVKAELSSSLTKKLLRFGIPVALAGSASVIISHTDTLLLTYFTSLSEVGLYNAALPTMKLISVMGLAMRAVVFPMSSELWTKGNKEKIASGLSMLYKYAFIVVFFISLIMFLFPEIILGILFGGEFRQAGIVLRILSVGYLIHTFASVNNITLSGIGKPKEVGKIMFSGAALNLVLNLILIPVYGMEGAAVSTLTAFIVIFILSVMRLRKHIPFIAPWGAFIKIIASGILVSGFIFFVKSLEIDIWTKLILSAALGCLMYAVLLLVSRVVGIDEVKGILRRII
ncbi:MAG: flippase [Candidatus Altiarchaeota archaeon]|nr:flippase [Candidatus Altiarchaeota archaeon]